MRTLEPKQLKFCQEFVVDCNGTKAAARAGYSPRCSKVRAATLMKNPLVKAEIARLQAELRERTQITAEQVINELAKIGFHNVQDYLSKGNTIRDFTVIPREHAASVSSIKVTERTFGQGKDKIKQVSTAFKLHDKRAALETLGKHLGIFEKDNDQRNQKVTIRVTAKK